MLGVKIKQKCARVARKSIHSHGATQKDVGPMLNVLRIGPVVSGCSNKHRLGSGASSTVQ